ncbi:MAG: HAMP domain-containing protein [Anaerolineae bacterium]|nr:HAMP domain-containing protein [Anaerolineae bacterium]
MMRLPIHLHLSLGYLAVLLIGMSLAATLSWLAVEQLYLDTQRENLLAQANLTAAALSGSPLPINEPEPYSQTLNTMPGIHTHILDEQDAVIVDLPLPSLASQVRVPRAEITSTISSEELMYRSEIRQALQGQSATAIRHVPAAGNSRVLYAAAPIFGVDGNPAGIVYLAMPLPSAGLPPDTILQFAGAVLIAALLAGAAGMLLARRISRPLEELAQAARLVAAGNLDQQVSTQNSIAELHSLSRDFNTMTAGLRQSDQAKNAFIADVTHELRTPLTVIKGTIETLEDGALDDLAGRGPLLTSMHQETNRLIRMVNDLLVLTRADAGALHLRVELLDVGEVARSRCERLAPLTARRHIDLRVIVEDTADLRAPGDPDRLAQVIDNLVDNAIRHAPDGSEVTVSVAREHSDVRCAVSDHGPGIPAQHLPLIFERFYRVDASRGRHTGGAGLGLAIVRALVLAQGGQVSAHSIEGEGTTITFRLPSN